MEKRGTLILTSPEIWKRRRYISRVGKTASEIVMLNEKRAIQRRDELVKDLNDIRNSIEKSGGDTYHLGVIDTAITDIMNEPSNYSMVREGTLFYLYQNGLARFVPKSLSTAAHESNF